MAITTSQSNGVERIQMANGSYLDDAGSPEDATITLGFNPRVIQVVNETDRITNEWYEGQADGYAVRTVAAGTRTLATSGGPTVGSDNRSFTFPVLQNKQYRWAAYS